MTVANAPLRVGIDYRPALLSRTGIARAVRETARALSLQPSSGEPPLDYRLYGHSVAAARVPPDLPGRGATLLRLPFPGRWLPGCSRRWPRLVRNLAGRPHLFHCTDYVYPPIPGAIRAVTLHDAAFAEDPAFHGPESAAITARVRAAVAEAELVFVPSLFSAQRAQDLLKVPAGKLRVTPWGADHVRRIGADRPAARKLLQGHGVTGPYVVMPGTIEPRKNHARVLRAWPKLPNARGVRLVLCGKLGWNVDALRPELERPDVLWLPDLGDRALFGVMAQAAAVIYPSLLEGFGFPPLEAMALGVPCLASQSPALTETCQDAALCVEPADEEAVADGIDRILGDRELRQRLIAEGHARVENYRWEKTAELHQVAYREVLARR